MAKQKEIKFRRDGKLFYGQQNGVKYSIHEARRLHEDESEQYYVSVNYPNERHRSFTTNGYRTFDLDGAKAFCQQVAAGEFDPAPIHAAQAAPELSPLEKAMRTPCPITRYKDKTLGDMVAADPNALVWIATKFTGDAEVIAAAKLICDQALASA